MWHLRRLVAVRTTGFPRLHSCWPVPLTCSRCCSASVSIISSLDRESAFGYVRADPPRLARSFLAYQQKGKMDQIVTAEDGTPSSSSSQEVFNFSAVLQYWFKDFDPARRIVPNNLWFGGSPEVDSEIKEKFEPTLKLATRGGLDHWATTPQGTLALVLVLDQFSRNIFRDTPQAFSQDATAQALTLDTIKKGWDRELGPMERGFLYIPLMHSEVLQVHEDAARAYEGLCEDYKEDQFLHQSTLQFRDFERQHFAVLSKYGRYPSRNAILGRNNTPEEEEYIASGRLWS